MRPHASAGRYKLPKAERVARLGVLRPLILAKICTKPQTVTHLMTGFDVYESEVRVILADLIAHGLATKIRHAGKHFYKGTP
jgi:hypothetical protein